MKTKTLTENINDLPKWAQSEISTLQMRLRESDKELNRLKSNPVSNTIVGGNYQFKGDAPLHYLKDNQMITFVINGSNITARLIGDYLEIMSDSFGGKDMFIRPKVSNVIQIHLL